jgi:NAD(P)-dependent dehydrogenase (short-subunit alcohol dehydrogenase family)
LKALSGKKAIITGASQGLGFEIARKFVSAGAEVMLCSRDKNALKKAQEELQKSAEIGQRVIAESADVSIESEVLEVVRKTLDVFGSCQILVNNAGVYGPKGDLESVNWAEWIKTLEINLYGSVFMSKSLVTHFKAQGYGKILQLSGGGATSPLPCLSAYAVSKAAIVRFAETLAEELRGTGVDVNCIAPGPLNTRMLDEILQAGPQKIGNALYDRSIKQKEAGGTPLSEGANLALFLASPASDGITAKLISAVWDNWAELPQHIDELARSDVFTLRRITGKDRGLGWG